MNTRDGRSKGWAAGLLAALAAAPAFGGNWQDPGAIHATAETVVASSFADPSATITVAAAPLDARLRVPACDRPLTGTVPKTTQEPSRVSVEVRCEGERPWRLFVPVAVSIRRTLVVAAVPLERGKVLAAGDVELAPREVSTAPGGYLTRTDAAVGQVLRRSVPAGAALAPALLEAPVVVRRGQPVTLEARSGAITVQMAGVARHDAALGETVAVENKSSRKILQGIVRNEKSIEIMLP